MTKVVVADNGCWIWTGERGRSHGVLSGYGYFTADKKRYQAHRWIYAHFNGAIPAGLTIDHVCHNQDATCPGGPSCTHRECVNPEHLEAVPNRTNVLRGKGSAAERARQTHCKRGHPLTTENTRVNRRGHRVCRVCERERVERYWESKGGAEAYNAYMRERRKLTASAS